MGAIWPSNGTGSGGGGGGGSGISGLTIGKIPVAASSSTIADGPFTIENAGVPYRQQVRLDGGGTGNVAALHIKPTNGSGNFGAGITLDNLGVDADGKQWMVIQLNSGTSYKNWAMIVPGITDLLHGLLISPGGNVYIGEDSGDLLDGTKLTVGGNLKFTHGGKLLFTVAAGGNWNGAAPANVEDAIDRLAAWVAAQGGTKP